METPLTAEVLTKKFKFQNLNGTNCYRLDINENNSISIYIAKEGCFSGVIDVRVDGVEAKQGWLESIKPLTLSVECMGRLIKKLRISNS